MSVKMKRLAAHTLAPLGALRVARKLAGNSRLLLLGYHRVLPASLSQTLAGDIELVSATPEDFAWQMRYLADRFEPVDFAQIADAIDGVRPLPRHAVAVTFDDGFFDLHTYALPILKQTGMRATIFVATDYVDSGGAFWFDYVAWVLRTFPVDAVPLPSALRTTAIEKTPEGVQRLTVQVLKLLKNFEESERQTYVAALQERFPTPTDVRLGRALNWQEIREMCEAGIEFGSHTASHRCLARLSPAELEYELVHSKRRLEEETGRSVAALAYPFGGRTAFSDAVIAQAQQAGYRVATTYMPGINVLATANRYALLRQHVERDTSRQYFEAIVNLPRLFR